MKLLGKLSQIFVETPYATMKYRYRQINLILGIVSAMLYLAFAIISLNMRNTSGEFAYWLIIVLTALTLVSIFLLFRMHNTKMRYSKKNYALITKILKKIIKLLVLITPVAILIKGQSFGTGWELGLRIYSLIHIIIILLTFTFSSAKLYYRFLRRHKYFEREQRGRVSTLEKIVRTSQEILKYIINYKNEEQQLEELDQKNEKTIPEKV